MSEIRESQPAPGAGKARLLARQAKAWIVTAWHRHHTRPFRIRMLPRAFVIWVRRFPDLANSAGVDGGGVYRIPWSKHLVVTREGRMLLIDRVQVSFATNEDASAALDVISARLLSRRGLVWAGRLLALGVGWLLASSYLQVRSQQQLAATPQPPVGAALADLPDVQSPYQAFPSPGAVDAPPAGARAVSQPVPAVPEPSPASLPATSPLRGFGLDLDEELPAVSPAASAPASPLVTAVDGGLTPEASAGLSALVAGPGCDPELAFKAPSR